MTLRALRTRFLLSLLLGALVFLGVAIYAEFDALAGALGRFEWWLLPVILALTSINYGLRFLKWEFYLRTIGVRGLSLRDSALLFFGGLAMVMTPGKVGEWLRSFLLKELTATPFMRSAPILVADRLSDGVAMLLLAMVGVLAFGIAGELVVVGALAIGLVVMVVQVRPLALWLLQLGERLPIVATRVHHLHELYASSYTLFQPRVMVPMILLGTVSWAFECVAMYVTYVGLGLEGSWDLLVKATFILAAATLAGSVLLLPGGLGAAEVTIVGFTQRLVVDDRGIASASALIIRLGTLWFGVLVGVLALGLFLRLQPRPRREAMLHEVETARDDSAHL